MSTRRQALLSAYWFAVSAHWTAILVVLLPAQAQQLGGDAFKGRTLGLVLLAGALVSMLVAPIAGALSDRLRGNDRSEGRHAGEERYLAHLPREGIGR